MGAASDSETDRQVGGPDQSVSWGILGELISEAGQRWRMTGAS